MATGVPARLTPREGRKFGLTVGIAFLILGGVSFWRGHDTAPWVLWSLGGLLTAAGLVIPGQLAPVHAAWMRFGLALSKITTPIFMGVIYFVVLTPTALLRRLFGGNPLARQAVNGSYWVGRTSQSDQSRLMTRQF